MKSLSELIDRGFAPVVPTMVEQSGLYALVSSDDVVYIGITTNLSRRIAGHAGKLYDTVIFLPGVYDEMLEKERELIKSYCPAYNIAGNPNNAKQPNSTRSYQSLRVFQETADLLKQMSDLFGVSQIHLVAKAVADLQQRARSGCSLTITFSAREQ
jgi:hypothetical protein